MKRKLLTIGYTGFTLDGFTAALVEHGIECLIDIREIPLSRKAGFSKSALKDHLNSVGIDYRHFRLLGSPKALRHKVRETGDYSQFFRAVRRHLKLTESLAELEAAIQVARSQRSCLMCCCPNWEQCHRKCVVDAVLERSYFTFGHISLADKRVVERRAA
ncbi:MAG: DUF488 domain-containing protein [Planctomycetota bacterium]|nr:MAG: DUF488 domain-containing protein [Planctomycetota bacterium]REK28395.1 MAG: DUF488 domain-containing protein [Planctomycetota bacterium]REK48411.1 MAG: DUF488 domain-containing protein [Planctomycetota bacterium]